MNIFKNIFGRKSNRVLKHITSNQVEEEGW